jgi:UDP-glucose 4-epimerase
VKIAVTGSAGQLGTVVLRRLAVERGVTALRSLDLRPPAVASAKLTHQRADVRDPDFGKFLDGCDALVHLAFIVAGSPPRAVFDAVNVAGSRNVFDAAARAGVKQIVYSSSIAAYGVVHGHPVPIVEETPRVYQRAFAYSAAKFEVEQFLDEFEPAHPEIAITRLRPSILVGAPTAHGLGAMLARRLLVDVGAPLSLVWDEDVAEVVALALRKRARGAYNVTSEPGADAAELARACDLRLVRVPRAVFEAGAQLSSLLARLGVAGVLDAAWMRAVGVPMVVSSDKARRELGWKPKCATPVDVVKRFFVENPSGFDRKLDLFVRLMQIMAKRAPADPMAARVNGRIHIRLMGPGGGDIGLLISDGKPMVIRETPRPPTTVVTMQAALFKQLLAGGVDYNTAQLTGKVRVEGEALAAMVVPAMIARFRTDAPKRLQRFLFKGAAT